MSSRTSYQIAQQILHVSPASHAVPPTDCRDAPWCIQWPQIFTVNTHTHTQKDLFLCCSPFKMNQLRTRTLSNTFFTIQSKTKQNKTSYSTFTIFKSTSTFFCHLKTFDHSVFEHVNTVYFERLSVHHFTTTPILIECVLIVNTEINFQNSCDVTNHSRTIIRC